MSRHFKCAISVLAMTISTEVSLSGSLWHSGVAVTG